MVSYPVSRPDAQVWYDVARKWFTLLSVLVGPVTFIINAPFGRFATKNASIFSVDGIKSWIVMELVSPFSFFYTFITSPLTSSNNPAIAKSSPLNIPPPHTYTSLPVLLGVPTLQLLMGRTGLLVSMYSVHYLNRAIISPLRAPSRSRSNIIVPLAAIVFNLVNGSLLGSYLSSPQATASINSRSPVTFYLGVVLWAMGFIGNVAHDEILYNIRRRARKSEKKEGSAEHYAIPYGLLYEYVTFPNYFCEWVEWFGFALATSPFPVTSFSSLSTTSLISAINSPACQFAPRLTPPWVFLITEIFTMFPRAYKGHKWYKKRFGDAYPKNRSIVIPGIL